jgi:hypothetical protein
VGAALAGGVRDAGGRTPRTITPAGRGRRPIADGLASLGKRQIIEGVICQLKEFFGLERHRAKTLGGLLTRLAAKVAAYTCGQRINDFLGRPLRHRALPSVAPYCAPGGIRVVSARCEPGTLWCLISQTPSSPILHSYSSGGCVRKLVGPVRSRRRSSLSKATGSCHSVHLMGMCRILLRRT